MQNFTMQTQDRLALYVRHWPCGGPRAVIQIVHGMAEHGGRYDAFARFLNQNGFAVVADDHRGHGKSVQDIKDLGYMADDNGFERLVEDEKQINDWIAKQYPGTPRVLLGHSMGSFASQRYFEKYGGTVDALLLTGTNSFPAQPVKLGRKLAKGLMKLHGRRYKSFLIDRLAFLHYHAKVPKDVGRYGWLTRDMAILNEYLHDQYCGAVFPVSFFYDLFTGFLTIHEKENLKRIPKDKPIYIFCGSDDPVGEYGAGPARLYSLYTSLGVQDVSLRLYPRARHELLNEINLKQVYADLLSFLTSRGF